MAQKKSTREYTEYEKKLQRYYRIGFISEFSKICIFLVIFAFLGLIPEYIIMIDALEWIVNTARTSIFLMRQATFLYSFCTCGIFDITAVKKHDREDS